MPAAKIGVKDGGVSQVIFFMRVIVLIILLMIPAVTLSAPLNNGNTNEKDLKADFDLYRNILQSAHAGLYKYRSKAEIDKLFARQRLLIKQNTSLEDFYRILCVIETYIGSLHDQISLPESQITTVSNLKEFFPYPLKIVDGKLLMNIAEKEVPLGSEIFSINNRGTQEIISAFYKFETADGFNITGKSIGINSKFPWHYRMEYGAAKEYRVLYKPIGSNKILKARIKPATYTDYKTVYAKRHSAEFDNRLRRENTFQLLEEADLAILTINTFALGSRKSEKHKAYKEFLEKTFQTLKDKQVKNLIVDIRKNGGGSDPNDLLTLSYLRKTPFRENIEAFTIFQKVPYPEYFHSDDNETVTEFEDDLRKEHNIFKDGKYYQTPEKNEVWNPNKLAFDGRIYLLISPAVASAASLFAASIKSEGRAIVIGEESMGGYYGHTGHIPITYELPKTRIRFKFSIVDLKQDVNIKPDIPFGRGVLPDIESKQSQKDFINNYDRVLNHTLAIVTK